MEQQHNKLTVDTHTPKEEVHFGDEKTSIIEDKLPDKVRLEKSPLPKFGRAKEPTEGKTYSKHISEFKAFGSGTVDLLCCRIDPEDTMVATGGADGIVHIYSFTSETDKPVHVMNAAEVTGIPITSLRWRPHSGVSKTKHVLVSSCADGSVSYWHVPSGKLLHRIIEPDNQVLALDYNKDGTNLATAGKDRKIRIYDENTKSVLVELAGGIWHNPGHSNRIFCIKYHPDEPNVILSGGWDNTIYFWDIRDSKSFASMYGPAISGDAIDIKNYNILTGSWRSKDQLELWDYGTRKKITNIQWDTGYDVDNAYIYACQFSKANDDTILAGCSNRNEVRVFDRTNNNESFGKVSHLTKGVYSVDYANSSDFFSFCGGDGRVHVVEIKNS